jgi:hypothetical protein
MMMIKGLSKLSSPFLGDARQSQSTHSLYLGHNAYSRPPSAGAITPRRIGLRLMK